MQRGVSLNELEQGTRTSGFDTTSKGFSKKDDKVNKIFWILAGVFGLVPLLVFGPRKLPEFGKGLGESIRTFKSAMKETPQEHKTEEKIEEIKAEN